MYGAFLLLLLKIEFMNIRFFTTNQRKLGLKLKFGTQSTVGRRLSTIFINHKNIFPFLEFRYIILIKNPLLLC